MSTTASVGKGYSTTAPQEKHLLYSRDGYRPEGGMPVALYVHSAGGDATEPLSFPRAGAITNTPYGLVLKAIADAGYLVLSADAGGQDTWGNPTVVARLGEMRTFAQANGGATSKVVVIGASAGGPGALAYAKANPSHVSCVLLFNPVADLQDIISNNRAGLGPRCNGSYPGGYSNATYGANHNPVILAPQITCPVQIWTSDQDSICVISRATALAAGLPNVDFRHGNWGDHGADTNYSNVSIPAVLDFLTTSRAL